MTYDDAIVFASSLADGASTTWSRIQASLDNKAHEETVATASFDFVNVNWSALQHAYGWAALQYQAWTRAILTIEGTSYQNIELYVANVLEFWIDDQHYFGGDFYGFGTAPVILSLSPGQHRLDIRLVRDVRAMGGMGRPTIDIEVKARIVDPGVIFDSRRIHVPDILNGVPFGSFIQLRLTNTANETVRVMEVIDKNATDPALIHFKIKLNEEVIIHPGQSRAATLLLSGDGPWPLRIRPVFKIMRSPGSPEEILLGPVIKFREPSTNEAYKMTFLRDNGVVDYAMVKIPDEIDLEHHCDLRKRLPIMLVLHGAGVDVDSPMATHALDDAGPLCAFVVFPTGGSPWSGDDWHQFGSGAVFDAVAQIRIWMNKASWRGPDPNYDRWIVVGHSNGGQGTWHIVTHHPDLIVSAAPVSGYSSIQSKGAPGPSLARR